MGGPRWLSTCLAGGSCRSYARSSRACTGDEENHRFWGVLYVRVKKCRNADM